MTRSEKNASSTTNDSRNRYEPLREDLRPFLEDFPPFGSFLRHRYYVGVIPDLNFCSGLHAFIDKQTAKADAAFEAQDWQAEFDCVNIHQRPEWLASNADVFPDDQYWARLSQTYQDQTLIYPNHEIFNDMFRSDRPGRENLMTPEEQAIFKRLPGYLTVYRGFDGEFKWEGAADGLSWSLDRRVAVWWANYHRQSESPSMVTGRIRKAHVWACFDNGDLVLPPEKVTGKKFSSAYSKKARMAFSEFMTKRFDIENFIKKGSRRPR